MMVQTVAAEVDDVREKLKKRVQEAIDEVRAMRDEAKKRNDEVEAKRIRRPSRENLPPVKP